MAGQVWFSDPDGGHLYSPELSDALRCAVQPLQKFRQFCDAEDGTQKGLHAGEKFHWNVYSDVGTQGDKIDETQPVPETSFKITQGELTVTEFSNSVNYTSKLDNLSLVPVQRVIHKVLKKDAQKAFDGNAYDEFNKCLLRAAPAAGTSTTALAVTENGSTVTTNNVPLGKGHVKALSDEMKERNIPPHRFDDYMAIGHPSTFRRLKDDLEAIHQYVETGLGLIMNGEIGRYESTRFIEQNFIPKGGAVDSTTHNWRTKTSDPWNNAASSWAFFFGDDTVMEAICIPEEMRGRIPTDYGRKKGIAWYYLGGFGIVHQQAQESRIFKWDSAA